ncbi:MAG: glycosyltransferase family 2 protein [bacterium]
MSATVILPARDEEECIGAVVQEIRRYFDGEVIVVDNGSTDRTVERATAAGARVVSEPVAGYGRACQAGAGAADSEVLVYMDADGSDCPEDIPALLRAIDRGASLALGVRKGPRVEPGSIAPAARFGNWFSGVLIGLATGRRLHDLSPLKAIRSDLLAAIDPQELTYGWTVEVLVTSADRGETIMEVSAGYRHRAGGQSKVSGDLRASVKAGYRILFVMGRFMLKRMTPVGAGALAGGAVGLIGLAAFTVWLLIGAPAGRDVLVAPWLLAWPLLLVTTLLGSGVGRLFVRTDKSAVPGKAL